MEERMQKHNSTSKSQAPDKSAMKRVIIFGIIAGLAGTAAMDIVMIAEFSVFKQPLTTNYAVIGSVLGGGIGLGVVLHILMGSILGIIFGLIVTFIRALQITSVGKGIGLGVVAGIVTVPTLCVPVSIITGISVLEFMAMSTIPHLAWGCVMGLIAAYGLRATIKSNN
jgi:hypothetical protein